MNPGRTSARHNYSLFCFEPEIEKMLEIPAVNCAAAAQHDPMLPREHQLRTYMPHGHIHKDTCTDFRPLLRNRGRVLNAGAHLNGFEPVIIEEMIRKIRMVKEN